MPTDHDRIRQVLLSAARSSPMSLPSPTSEWARMKFRLRYHRERTFSDWSTTAILSAVLLFLVVLVSDFGSPPLVLWLASLLALTAVAAFVISSLRIP
jgi:hypothetical protein